MKLETLRVSHEERNRVITVFPSNNPWAINLACDARRGKEEQNFQLTSIIEKEERME